MRDEGPSHTIMRGELRLGRKSVISIFMLGITVAHVASRCSSFTFSIPATRSAMYYGGEPGATAQALCSGDCDIASLNTTVGLLGREESLPLKWKLAFPRHPTRSNYSNWTLLEQGRKMRALHLMSALKKINAVSRPFAAFFDTHDVWLTPTMGGLAPLNGY